MASDPDAEAKIHKALEQAVEGGQGDFKMTQEEAGKMKQAFEQPEFRKMFQDYLEEISDPKNREEYETYLSELEGGDKVPKGMELVRPNAGFALKTKLEKTGDKVFLNVVSSDKIGKPESKPSKDANGRTGVSWSLPHSVGQPRMEADRKGNQCLTLDVCYHPDTLRMATSNRPFRNMLAGTTIDAAQSAMDRNSSERGAAERRLSKDYHVLRGVPCVGGKPGVLMMRKDAQPTPPNPQPAAKSGAKGKASAARKGAEPSAGRKAGGAASKGGSGGTSAASTPQASGAGLRERTTSRAGTRGGGAKAAAEGPVEPSHTIVHRGMFELQGYLDVREREQERPKELVVRIDLPRLASMKGVGLDVSSTALSLTAGSAYRLNLALPFPVEDERGSAKFDKASRRLTVVLPVQAPPKAAPKPFVEPSPEPDQGVQAEEGGDSDEQKSRDVPQRKQQQPRASPPQAPAATAGDGDEGEEDDLASLGLPDDLVAQLREARAQVQREREEAERARAAGGGSEDSTAAPTSTDSAPTSTEAATSSADTVRNGGTEAVTEPGGAAAAESGEANSAGASDVAPASTDAAAGTAAGEVELEVEAEQPSRPRGEEANNGAAKALPVRMLGHGEVRHKQTPRALSLLLQVPDVDAASVQTTFSDTEFRVDFVDAAGVAYAVAGCTHAAIAAPERCRFDVSSRNVVVVLRKREAGRWPEEEALTLRTEPDFCPSASAPPAPAQKEAEAASAGPSSRSAGPPTPPPAATGTTPAAARGQQGTAPAKAKEPTRRANPALFELD